MPVVVVITMPVIMVAPVEVAVILEPTRYLSFARILSNYNYNKVRE
jgi:hypothetical protein